MAIDDNILILTQHTCNMHVAVIGMIMDRKTTNNLKCDTYDLINYAKHIN